jgi:hypothetical protein
VKEIVDAPKVPVPVEVLKYQVVPVLVHDEKEQVMPVPVALEIALELWGGESKFEVGLAPLESLGNWVLPVLTSQFLPAPAQRGLVGTLRL